MALRTLAVSAMTLRRVEIAWTRSSPSFEVLGADQDYVRARSGGCQWQRGWIGPQGMRGVPAK